MKSSLFGRKTRATLLALVLALSLALTGTLAWRSISQVEIGEVATDSNPGGRVHDDFKGTENKDIYVENFTDTEKGVPVFARIRLLEYMETGDDAGINRDATNRNAKPVLAGANINQPSTWHIHKPGESATDDPFHNYWEWVYGGSTAYLPTFNKNKDSLSVDVNGSYVGKDKNFLTGTPYDDYNVYTVGQDVTAIAYYDADGNDKDEYDPTKPGQVPGGGGTEWSTTNTKGNYIKVEEKHTVKSTLNSVGVLTMQEWKDKGCPVGNFWVWDTDGWAYWAKPIMPQTATGLLLTKINEKTTPAEKSYYAIEVVGQLATAFQWGDPDKNDGFYPDGFTDDAKKLLDQVASIKTAADGKDYIYRGQNVYQQILDDAGNMGDPICAGEDGEIGNADDKKDVIYIEGGIDVGGNHYGDYFLKPTEDEPYYKAPGPDNLLGKEPDAKLWVPDGGKFPEDAVDAVADSIVLNGPTELEAGASGIAYTATVKLGAEDSFSQVVLWTVSTTDGSPVADGTFISDDGKLTIAEGELAPRLVVRATCKLDPSVTGIVNVKVVGEPNIKITLQADDSVPTQIQAGKSMQLQAKLYYGEELAETQPEYTWEATTTTRTVDVDNPVMSETTKGLLTVGRNVGGTVIVTATATVNGEELTGQLNLEVTDAEPVTLHLTEEKGRTTVDAGGTLKFDPGFNTPDELPDTSVKWEVGTSTDEGVTIKNINGVTMAEDGTLTVAGNGAYQYTAGVNDEIYIRATANDFSAEKASDMTKITILPPTAIELKVKDNPKAFVVVGNSYELEAIVRRDKSKYAGQEVTWSVESPRKKAGTQISSDGVLTIDPTEPPYDTLTIKAVSKVTKKVVKTMQVTVDFVSVTYDGIEYVVVLEDTANNRRLILAREVLPSEMRFNAAGTSCRWEDSDIRTYLNGEWLDNQPELQAALADPAGTRITTRQSPDSTGFITTTDKVFLLSEADYRGEVNQQTALTQDYTAGKKLFECTFSYNQNLTSGHYVWARSPRSVSSKAACVYGYRSSSSGSVGVTELGFVRPACWVKIHD